MRQPGMAATSAKTQILPQVFNLLKKKMPAPAEPEKKPVMEELIYAICREGVTSAEADQAFSKLKSSQIDWNDVRVSTVPEISNKLGDIPESGSRAKQIIEFLQELFEMQYAFNLDDLEKKGLKQASKQLSRYQAVSGNDYLVAWVVQRALGGHAIPLDEPTLRVLKRLGVLDNEIDDIESARGSIEAAIVKAKGLEFTELLSSFASSVCTEARPACKTCPLKADCPTGQGLTSTTKKAAVKNETKSETKADVKPKKSR